MCNAFLRVLRGEEHLNSSSLDYLFRLKWEKSVLLLQRTKQWIILGYKTERANFAKGKKCVASIEERYSQTMRVLWAISCSLLYSLLIYRPIRFHLTLYSSLQCHDVEVLMSATQNGDNWIMYTVYPVFVDMYGHVFHLQKTCLFCMHLSLKREVQLTKSFVLMFCILTVSRSSVKAS